jgi:predicted  nucleic acid-binding Zn-ribbon protein
MVALKEKPLLKLNKEIESKKSNIQNLRAEIKDLKNTCDELSKSLQIVENSNSSIEAEII